MRSSGMVNAFNKLPEAKIPRSSFNRSHGHKTCMDAGKLIPVYVDEILPGDTFNVKASMFARMVTPIVPIMDNMYLDVWFFFVPNRLVWVHWNRFCGEQTNPGDSTDYTIPQCVGFDAASSASKEFMDYMGIPTNQVTFNPLFSVNTLPFRGYNLIWNDWFRDENLQTRRGVNTDGGPDNTSGFAIQNVGRKHDYFSSCLPWPQKGPGVEIPIGAIVSNGVDVEFDAGNGSGPIRTSGSQPFPIVKETGPAGNNLVFGDESGLEVDQSTAGTINSLRTAYQIQRLLERDARGGTRYTELVRSHFGVTSPDARLQRSEFLGGGRIPVNIHQVPQTSQTGTTPQGNLAAYGVVAGSAPGFVKSFTEHGFLFCLAAVRADITYQQGLDRKWTRKTRYDHYWPALAFLGEQAVLNKEIYVQGLGFGGVDDEVFGYQERWAEYRMAQSRTSREMSSRHTLSLDYWHLGEEYTALPTLGATWIQHNPPVDRVSAVPSQPHFMLDAWFDIKAARAIPVFSVPGMSDHF